MVRVASRDLRNDTAGVLRRAAEGEEVVVTVRGEPVARLVPICAQPRRWIGRTEVMARLRRAQADPGLRTDLARLGADTTDDLGPVR